jgi:ubiquitin-like protein Pup
VTERVQKQKTSTERVEKVGQDPPKTKDAAALKADLDDLLDEIDEVLESEAAEFVASYIQKGGQ